MAQNSSVRRPAPSFASISSDGRCARSETNSKLADIACDDDYQPAVSGERRTLVLQYYHTLDFTKPADVKKLLQAFENILNAEMERIER